MPLNNKNIIKKIIARIDNTISENILNFMDYMSDRQICGRSLVKYVPSIFRDDSKGVGGTGSQSTHYISLKRIFSHVTLSPSDNFLDVGCGKGRVLAFLVKQNSPGNLYGIEHNEEVGKLAADWAQKYEQVHIIIGDAFKQDYNDFTVLFFARPFLPTTFRTFLDYFEKTLTHPVKVIYWVDQESGFLLNNRPGWTMQMRDTISRIHGLKIAPWPQSYSIWIYDPNSRAASGKR